MQERIDYREQLRLIWDRFRRLGSGFQRLLARRPGWVGAAALPLLVFRLAASFAPEALRVDDEVGYLYFGLLLDSWRNLPTPAGSPVAMLTAAIVGFFLKGFFHEAGILSGVSAVIRVLVVPLLCVKPFYDLSRAFGGRRAAAVAPWVLALSPASLYIVSQSNSSHGMYQVFLLSGLGVAAPALKALVLGRTLPFMARRLAAGSALLGVSALARVGDGLTFALISGVFFVAVLLFRFKSYSPRRLLIQCGSALLPFPFVFFGYLTLPSMAAGRWLDSGGAGRTWETFQQGYAFAYPEKVKKDILLEGNALSARVFNLDDVPEKERTVLKAFVRYPRAFIDRCIQNTRHNLVSSVGGLYWLYSGKYAQWTGVLLAAVLALFVFGGSPARSALAFAPFGISVFAVAPYAALYFREGYFSQYWFLAALWFPAGISAALSSPTRNRRFHHAAAAVVLFSCAALALHQGRTFRQILLLAEAASSAAGIPALEIDYARSLARQGYAVMYGDNRTGENAYLIARYALIHNAISVSNVPSELRERSVFISNCKVDYGIPPAYATRRVGGWCFTFRSASDVPKGGDEKPAVSPEEIR